MGPEPGIEPGNKAHEFLAVDVHELANVVSFCYPFSECPSTFTILRKNWIWKQRNVAATAPSSPIDAINAGQTVNPHHEF